MIGSSSQTAPAPFLLDEYIPGELIRLTANKSYHLGARPTSMR